MLITETGFHRILELIRPLLITHGFSEKDHTANPGAFGSRYITFADDQEFIRLTWDGKERWYVLESVPLSPTIFESGWADILLQFFKPEQESIKVIEEIAQDMKLALTDYLAIQI